MDFYLLAYSEQFNLQKIALEYLAILQELCTLIDVKLTHMDYAVVSENDDNVGISNEISFNPGSINLLRDVLNVKLIDELAVWSLEDEKDENSSYKVQSEIVVINQTARFKFVYIQFPIKQINKFRSVALFSFISNLISMLNRLGRIDSAFVTTMKPFLPQTFSRTIFAPGLSETEATDLAMWNRREGERKIRLRGLYWGNY